MTETIRDPLEDVGEPAHILLIEDDRLFANLAEKMLASIRETVVIHHVTTLADAIDALEHRHFACVISDLKVPDSDPELTAFFCDKISRETSVIIVSGDANRVRDSLQQAPRVFIQLLKSHLDPAAFQYAVEMAIERDRLRTLGPQPCQPPLLISVQ